MIWRWKSRWKYAVDNQRGQPSPCAPRATMTSWRRITARRRLDQGAAPEVLKIAPIRATPIKMSWAFFWRPTRRGLAQSDPALLCIVQFADYAASQHRGGAAAFSGIKTKIFRAGGGPPAIGPENCGPTGNLARTGGLHAAGTLRLDGKLIRGPRRRGAAITRWTRVWARSG